MADSPSPPGSIERWELAGGTWRLAAVGPRSATVELLRCDGGEAVEMLVLREPDELRWAAARWAILDEDPLA